MRKFRPFFTRGQSGLGAPRSFALTMIALTLTRMSTFPKGPREMTNGMAYFPRMLDKIRLHARGELAEDYHANLGDRMDKYCVDFLRVGYAKLRDCVLAGRSDEEVLAWCFKQGRPLSKGDLHIWNAFILKRGWNDEASEHLAEMKIKFGVGDRADIATIPQLLDLDEGRTS
jgi:gluconokinase